MTNRFQDKVVIVTGAASGIGRAVVERVASEGGSVLAADLNQDMLKKLSNSKSQIEILPCDANDPGTASKLAATTLSRFGAINGFVPCAGTIKFAPVTEVSPAQWDAVIDINLRAVFFQVQAIGKAMIAGGHQG